MKKGMEKDKYIEGETYIDKYGNKITVRWPDISEEENQRRMKRIRESAVRLVLAADRARAEAKREEVKRLEKERA